MLQSKDIKKISELKNGFTHRWLEPDFIKSSLKSFSFSSLCNCLKPLKTRGYDIRLIFSILISIPFVASGSSSIHSVLDDVIRKQLESGKDTFYRFLNNPRINWRLILWLFAHKFMKKIDESSTVGENNGPKCMVFDDTVLKKVGRFIENISRVRDHTDNSYVIGFKMLLMGYWDGISFIPLDFSLHRERGNKSDKPFGLKKREMKRQYKKKRDKTAPGEERNKETDSSKISNAIKMFKRAIGRGVSVDYVLLDSWFTCEAFIDAVLGVKGKTHLLGMYKIATSKFVYNERLLTYKQLNNALGKAKRCRSLRLYYKEAIVKYKGKEVKLFFSRQGKRGKWKVFLSTDTSLSFIKMIEIYQIRWSIEVFFKESKQLFGLGRCQSNDFDGQIADTTLVLIQHLMLTLRYRFDKYETMGRLFKTVQSEMLETRLNERLWGLFVELLNLIELVFDGIDAEELFERLFNHEKACQRIMAFLEISGDIDYKT